jgi:uncharacterized repeat protein (TIGR01451 family)
LVSVTEVAEPLADLSLSKVAHAAVVLPGDLLTYTLTVENLGPDSATGVVLTDTLPAGVLLQSATAGQGNCAALGAVLNCDLGTVDVGETAEVIVVVTVPAGEAALTNTAVVASELADSDPGNNVATVEVLVRSLRTYFPVMFLK